MAPFNTKMIQPTKQHQEQQDVQVSHMTPWMQFARQLSPKGRAKTELSDVFDLARIPSQNQELMHALFTSFRDYLPRPYSRKLTLVRARTGSFFRGRSPDLGWGRFVSTVDIRPIPGNHETSLHPPHVIELAKQLRDLIEDLG